MEYVLETKKTKRVVCALSPNLLRYQGSLEYKHRQDIESIVLRKLLKKGLQSIYPFKSKWGKNTTAWKG